MTEREIFIAAIQVDDEAQRLEYLDGACGADRALRQRVDRLLETYRQAGSFLESPPTDVEQTVAADSPHHPGTFIGPYKLMQQLGEGGMGVVYLAEQAHPVQRKVALKIIKPGMDSRQVIARFEAERQALAMMDHPHIARVLDAGTTETGRPYFVMELVKGISITRYCDQEQLTPQERLALFIPVCQAVQHAHQKGIIHRDLKPSNVLVTLYDGRPVPKVIDFGVAKATAARLTNKTIFTEVGAIVGTLEYMAPEQAELSNLDIDTRADIYSLGVILYELLAGSPPFTAQQLRSASFDEMLRIIREVEPPKPSSRLSSVEELPDIAARRKLDPKKLARAVHGELDWIVMKCLEKERGRRYGTATDLANDVHRYLASEAVLAGPPSLAYRFRKFARRNKRSLITMAVVALAILLSVGALGWAVRDRMARDEQIARNRVARQAKLTGELQVALERAELFHKAEQRPEALAAFERAELLAEETGDLEMRKRLLALKGQLVAEAKDQDFITRFEEIRLQEQSQVNEAESRFIPAETYPKTREILRQYGVEIGVVASAQAAERIHNRPTVVQGYLLAALQECLTFAPTNDVQTRKWLIEALDAADPDLWRTQLRKASAAGDRQALEDLARQVDVEKQPPSILLLAVRILDVESEATSIELLRRIQRAYPADFFANHALALALYEAGQPAESIRYYTAALALRSDNQGVYLNRGNALRAVGELDAAIADLRKSVALAPGYFGANNNLVTFLREKGDVEGAMTVGRQAVAIAPTHAWAHDCLGTALQAKGDLDGAIAAHRQAIAIDPKYAPAHNNFGLALRAKGDVDRAIAAHRQAIAIDPKYAPAHNALGVALRMKGDVEEAITAYRQAIAINPKAAVSYANLGNALQAKGDVDEAIAAYRQAIAIDPRLALAHNNLGQALHPTGDLEGAIAAFRQAVAIDPKMALAHNNLGSALFEKRDLVGAIAAYRQVIAIDPKSGPTYHSLGSALLKNGDVEGAITALRRAIDVDPNDAPAHNNLGNALNEQGDWDGAIAVLHKALALDPTAAKTHVNLGNALRAKGDAVGAIAAYRQAIDFDPKFASAHNNLGNSLQNKGDHEGAIAAYRQAIAIDPKHAPAHFNIGHVLQMRRDWDGAITSYRQAIAIDPKLARAHNNIGLTLQAKGDVKGAIDAYRQAIATDPKFVLAHDNLGSTLGQKGDFVAAAGAWKIAVELNPHDAWLWYCLADAHLAAGKRDAYRLVCADMLNRFGETQDSRVADRVLYTCLPLSDAFDDMTRLLPLAELAATNKANARLLGAALYRAGKYEAAIEPLTQGQARAWDHLFLAMAHRRLGRVEKAREFLELAIGQIEKGEYPWMERVESEQLRGEAEKLIRGTGKDSTPPQE